LKYQIPDYHDADARLARALAFSIFLFSLGCPSAALSFETESANNADYPGRILLSPKPPTPTVTDPCLPLLKSIRHETQPSVTDRNQRPAGEAATLALVFGLRFALGPVERTGRKARPRTTGQFDLWLNEGAYAGDRYALAVSDYRRCRKDQALRALTGPD
jgi:hypothetical protein